MSFQYLPQVVAKHNCFQVGYTLLCLLLVFAASFSYSILLKFPRNFSLCIFLHSVLFLHKSCRLAMLSRYHLLVPCYQDYLWQVVISYRQHRGIICIIWEWLFSTWCTPGVTLYYHNWPCIGPLLASSPCVLLPFGASLSLSEGYCNCSSVEDAFVWV
jgi:hypothetical protein